MQSGKETGLKASAFAALTLAFASFGDAFLYPFLPLHFDDVGIPLAWVGLLLSVNRFVRIISNTAIVHALAKYGIRTMVLLAALLAVMSTFGYGIASGWGIWLLFRIMWGLAFSILRLGTLSYALQQQRRGFALGISKGIQEAGPMAALLMTPFILEYFEPAKIFYLLALLSVPSFYFAWQLPRVSDKTQPLKSMNFFQWPSSLNSITFISAMLIDGIVVVVMGVLFLHDGVDVTPITATVLAAFYISYKRVCLVAFSPVGGWIADRVGFERIFNISTIFVIAGLILILTGWMRTGFIVVFTFYSMNTTVTPGSIAQDNNHSLAAAAENATWRDIGAALGTLLGGFLIASAHLHTVLIVIIFVFICFLFVHLGISLRPFKQLFIWK